MTARQRRLSFGRFAAIGAVATLATLGQPARATTTCTATTDNFDFGSIALTSAATLTGMVRVTCQTSSGLFSQDVKVSYCVNIGEGNGGAGPSLSPRWLRNSANESLVLDLTLDSLHLIPIGSTTLPATVPISGTMNYQGVGLQTTSFTTTHVIHARIPAQPVAAIGGYQSSFAGLHTELLFRSDENVFGATMPGSCRVGGNGGNTGASIRAPFSASALIEPECQLGTVDLLDFGNVSGLPGPAVTASAAITMNCRRGTAWQLSLDDGQNAQGQQRRMSNGNGSYAPYELYRNAPMTQRFGQTANVDRQAGTGTGTNQTVMVHGRMPAGQNLVPGSYSDRVVVTVTY